VGRSSALGRVIACSRKTWRASSVCVRGRAAWTAAAARGMRNHHPCSQPRRSGPAYEESGAGVRRSITPHQVQL